MKKSNEMREVSTYTDCIHEILYFIDSKIPFHCTNIKLFYEPLGKKKYCQWNYDMPSIMMNPHIRNMFNSVQLLSRVQLFATPWTAAHQASLSISNSQSLPKLMSIESVIPSNHLILCYPLLLLPSVFPSIRVFPNESVLRIRWPKYWSFSFTISPSNGYSGLISFRLD